MAHVYDHAQQKWVEIDDSAVTAAVSTGKVQFASGRAIPVISPEGEQVLIPSNQATAAFRNGYQYRGLAMDAELTQQLSHKLQIEGQQTIPAMISAPIVGAARTVTAGLSDALIRATGGQSAVDAVRANEEANPALTTAGEFGGMFVPFGAAAKVGGLAIKAGAKVAGRMTPAMAKMTARLGQGSLMGRAAQTGGQVLQTGVKFGTAGALESGLVGVQQSISDYALDRDQASAENTIAQVGLGSILGGGAGFGLGIVGRASGMLGKAALNYMNTGASGKGGMRAFVANNYPKLFKFMRGLKGEAADVVDRVFKDKKLANDVLDLQDNPDLIVQRLKTGVTKVKKAGAEFDDLLGLERKSVVSKMDLPGAGVRTSSARKSWGNIKRSFEADLKQAEKFPDLYGGKQASVVRQLMSTIDERLAKATSASEVHNAFRESLTDLNQVFGELAASKAKDNILKGVREKIDVMTKSQKIWGKSAAEYEDINKLFAKNISIRKGLFGSKGKAGMLTEKTPDGVIEVTDASIDRALKSAAQERGKRVTTWLNAFEESNNNIISYLKRNPNAAQNLPAIQKSLADGNELVQNLFSAKVHNVIFNRQQTMTGKILQGPVTGALAGSMLGGIPGAATVTGAAGLGMTAMSNPQLMLRYAHGSLAAHNGLSTRTFNAVGSFLNRKNVGQRLTNAGLLGGAYTVGRAAKSLGEDRKRNETDLDYMTRAIRRYAADPMEMEKSVRSAMWGMSSTLEPQYYRMVNTAQKAVMFLNSKLPPLSSDPFSATQNSVQSLSQEMQLQSYVEAIWKPSKILAELEGGNLQLETVEAVREVYPEFYNEIRGVVIDKIMKDSPKLDYYKKLDIATLFGIPTMAGLNSIQDLQAALAQSIENPKPQPTPSGTSKTSQISMAGSEALQARRVRA